MRMTSWDWNGLHKAPPGSPVRSCQCSKSQAKAALSLGGWSPWPPEKGPPDKVPPPLLVYFILPTPKCCQCLCLAFTQGHLNMGLYPKPTKWASLTWVIGPWCQYFSAVPLCRWVCEPRLRAPMAPHQVWLPCILDFYVHIVLCEPVTLVKYSCPLWALQLCLGTDKPSHLCPKAPDLHALGCSLQSWGHVCFKIDNYWDLRTQ